MGRTIEFGDNRVPRVGSLFWLFILPRWKVNFHKKSHKREVSARLACGSQNDNACKGISRYPKRLIYSLNTRVIRKVLGVTGNGLDENHELFYIVLSDLLEVNSSSFSPP